ncbi:GH25 family lysozyme, partial [Enterococcus eurekensis]
MMRKIYTGIAIIGLLVSQITNVSVVFSDEVQGRVSIEQNDESSISTVENKEISDSFNESIESINGSFERIEEMMNSDSETEIFSEETIEEEIEEITNTTSSQEAEEDMADNSSESTEYIESIDKDSTETLEYEEVFYNNQRFQFPIQEEIEEIEKNLKDNHRLGAYTKSKSNGDLFFSKITEKQQGRPHWNFIDVSSHQGELSVADYEYMKKQGVTGVVVKLTEGTFYTNPFARTQIENAEKAGLKASTYHFSRYTTKKGAESEAIYYAKEAKRLNLTSDTVMVNSLEVNLNEYSTQNAIFFANKLKEHGFRNLVHYTTSLILEESKLSTSILGDEYLWIAEYPEEPAEKNRLHSMSSAWQWSNEMTFELIPGKIFGVSSDYKGMFSNPIEDEDKIIEPIKDSSITSEKKLNKYTTITAKDFVFWKDLSFQTKNGMSSKYFQQTLFVEKEFTLSGGEKYLSIKDKNNKLLGYVDEKYLTLVNGEQGAHQEYGKYVSIKGTNDIWDGFAWKNSKSGLAYKNQTFQARGVYHHFNGSRYLSLYD